MPVGTRIAAVSIIILLAGGTTHVQAAAIEFSSMVVFGDSLSDTGNLYAAMDGQDPTTDPPPFTWDNYVDGRFSNGPVWVEHLADRLVPGAGRAAVQPFSAGGRNFAFSSARTGGDTSPLGAPNMGTQVGMFLGAGGPTGDELFVFWGGGNDLLLSDDPPDLAAGNIAAHVETLASAGATDFLVPNLPALGEMPAHQGTDLGAALNQRTQAFNDALADALQGVRQAQGVTIHEADVHTLFNDVMADPEAFDLDVTDEPWLLSDGELDPDRFLFWDNLLGMSHPTSVGHQLLTEDAYQTVIPEPATFGVLAAGLALLAVRRPRRQRA